MVAAQKVDPEILALKSGDEALLEVKIFEPPCSDVTNVKVADRRGSTRFWVPTALLRMMPKIVAPAWCERIGALWQRLRHQPAD